MAAEDVNQKSQELAKSLWAIEIGRASCRERV